MEDKAVLHDQWKFQHCTDGGMVHSQSDQPRLIRVESAEGLDQPKPRGCKDNLSEAQKREKKRQSDVKYRLKKKIKVDEMNAQNKSLQEEVGQLSTENRRLREETGQLTAEKRHSEQHIREMESKGKLPAEVILQRESNDISQSISQIDPQSVYVQNKCLQEEIEHLSTENKRLKEEKGLLTTENRHLKEQITELQSMGKLPAEVLLQKQDSYISQSSQYKRENNQILTRINITTQHYLNIEAENSVLRAELMELEQRLLSLEDIITCLNKSNMDADDTSLAFIESNDLLNPFNLVFSNQPVLASLTVFQY